MTAPRLFAAALAAVAFAAGPAAAADLIIDPAPVYDEPAGYDWTGPYVGINAGFAFGLPHASTADDCDWYCYPGVVELPGGDPLSDDLNDAFPFFGIQAGFNYQVDANFVLGIEADIQTGDLAGRGNDDDDPEVASLAPPPWVSDLRPDLDWWGTLRGRAGVTMDRTLIYATGGLAWGHTTTPDFWWLPDGFGTEETRVGYAIGAGIEHAVNDSISVKAEYLFVNLGDQGDLTPFEGGDFNSDLAFHSIRAGINFHF